MKYILIILLFCSANIAVFSQKKAISGRVMNENNEVLQYANVWWENTSVGTITDTKGNFSLKQDSHSHRIIVSYVGYKNDTIEVHEIANNITVTLVPAEIEEVTINEEYKGSVVSGIKTIQTEVISSAGLEKLACCNLSESFENNTSVDVSYSDAITGAKQIKLLGLSGVYTQLMTENVPAIRGLSAPYGLSYIPGPWMEGIYISKGTSSVLYGYESIAGQINIEFNKPEKSNRLYVNTYGNSEGRIETNIYSAFKKKGKTQAMAMIHASDMRTTHDNNKDGFLDIPMSSQINFLARINYDDSSHVESKTILRVLAETRDGGQTAYYTAQANKNAFYKTQISAQNAQLINKTGFHIEKREGTSIGVINSVSHHSNNAVLGNRSYKSFQNSLYSNIIFQTYIGTTEHTIQTGTGFQIDDYAENLDSMKIANTEYIPGVFAQYNYSHYDKLNIIAGARIDYNSLYGYLFSPRIHAKYIFSKHTTIRGSAGKGYRTPFIFSDNIGVLSSSREIFLSEYPDIERALNFGMNVTQTFLLKGGRNIILSVDGYRTQFLSQLITDMDANPQKVYYYNSSGTSFSNVLQAQLVINPISRMDVTLAFRYTDVKATINDTLREKPLTPRYKTLASVHYYTKDNKWSFDLTGSIRGKSRIPSTSSNPAIYRVAEYSPAYFNLLGQISRQFKYFEIYIGSENITGYTQETPFIAANDPFGKYFDASLVWGPLTGRMIYGGVRFIIK